MSFPLRERGLKRVDTAGTATHCSVVPLAGTWIETLSVVLIASATSVVPLAGTWIETA